MLPDFLYCCLNSTLVHHLCLETEKFLCLSLLVMPTHTPIWAKEVYSSFIYSSDQWKCYHDNLTSKSLHLAAHEKQSWLMPGPFCTGRQGQSIALTTYSCEDWTKLLTLWNQRFWKCRSWSHPTLTVDFFPVDRPGCGDKDILQIIKSVL